MRARSHAPSRALLPLCLLLSACQTSGWIAAPAPDPPLAARWTSVAAQPEPAGAPAGRLERRSASERAAWGAASDAALHAPASAPPGRLRGSIAYLAPDTVNLGMFYAVDDCWTVGLLGQRLVQKRTVEVEGQLIDLDNLDSYVPGFSIEEETESVTFGPFVRYRVMPERAAQPEVTLNAYALQWGTLTSASTRYSRPGLVVRADEDAASEGDAADSYRSVYMGVSKHFTLPGAPSFLWGLRAYAGTGFGVRTGQRYAVLETGAGDPRLRARRREVTRQGFVGWVGAEVQLPESFSLYGEVFTGDECDLGYGAGLRWTSPLGITFTLGFTNCLEAIPQRSLDLVYLPGGVGGQLSLVGGAGGGDGGALGYQGGIEERTRGRGRTSRR